MTFGDEREESSRHTLNHSTHGVGWGSGCQEQDAYSEVSMEVRGSGRKVCMISEYQRDVKSGVRNTVKEWMRGEHTGEKGTSLSHSPPLQPYYSRQSCVNESQVPELAFSSGSIEASSWCWCSNLGCSGASVGT